MSNFTEGYDAAARDDVEEFKRLEERIAALEAENTLLAASLRKAEDALRPFAEHYRSARAYQEKLHPGVEFHSGFLGTGILLTSHFSRAAELVPERSRDEIIDGEYSAP
jgi:hypothetical protein